MASQEIWVHGTSAQLHVIDEDWGTAIYDGLGLYLEARVQEKQPSGAIKQTGRQLWVHFHVPTPSGTEHVVRLKKVMLRFSTDCNPPGMYPDPTKPHPYLQTSRGFEKYRMDCGGAIIDQIDVLDAEKPLGSWPVNAQSKDITDFVVMPPIVLNPEMQVQWGVGVGVRLRFINQYFVEKLICNAPGHMNPDVDVFTRDPDWDGKPWLNRAVASDTKHAWLTSVGCEFITTP